MNPCSCIDMRLSYTIGKAKKSAGGVEGIPSYSPLTHVPGTERMSRLTRVLGDRTGAVKGVDSRHLLMQPMAVYYGISSNAGF